MAGLDYLKVRDQTADIGTLVHYLIPCQLKGEEPDLSDCSPQDLASASVSMEKFNAWLEGKTLEPILLEEPMVSEEYGFGGTPDYFGGVDGKLTLLDFKTSGAIYPENFYQLAAYVKLLEEHGYKVESARIIRVSRVVDENYEDRPAGNLENYWKVFLACREIYELQKTIRREKKALE